MKLNNQREREWERERSNHSATVREIRNIENLRAMVAYGRNGCICERFKRVGYVERKKVDGFFPVCRAHRISPVNLSGYRCLRRCLEQCNWFKIYTNRKSHNHKTHTHIQYKTHSDNQRYHTYHPDSNIAQQIERGRGGGTRGQGRGCLIVKPCFTNKMNYGTFNGKPLILDLALMVLL